MTDLGQAWSKCMVRVGWTDGWIGKELRDGQKEKQQKLPLTDYRLLPPVTKRREAGSTLLGYG